MFKEVLWVFEPTETLKQCRNEQHLFGTCFNCAESTLFKISLWLIPEQETACVVPKVCMSYTFVNFAALINPCATILRMCAELVVRGCCN